MNHQLLLVRMAMFIDQKYHVWCAICVKEDGQHEPGMSTNKNLILVMAEQCQNFVYANDLYFA